MANFMRDEIRKINGIIDEITSLFMRKGSVEIDVKIKREDSQTVINIIDYNTKYSDDEIKDLDYILNIQRQCEIEGFYWELTGDDNQGDELFLVGSMIDSATVEKLNNDLYICMYRKCLYKSSSTSKG